MADHVDITLWIDRRWKVAIEKHLKDETLEEHLEDVLDELCNQLPEREYEHISAEIYAEDAARRTEEEATRTYAAYHVTERGQEWYFKTSLGEELLAVGKKLRGYYRLPYPEAVLLLLGRKNRKTYEQAKPVNEVPKAFALPEPYGTMRRMYAYLMRQRHIDREVISAFVHEKLLYEDKHHNCVFVGLDDSGEAKHAHIRSTNSEGRVFRMNIEGSASEHCFHKSGTDKSLYVFEAPIDLLSHITLYPYGWQEHSYVACCGLSIQPVLERLRQNPKLDMVYLCLDNDDAGKDACDRMTDTLEDMGLDVERLCPVRKDWNDDLCAKFERKEKDA